MQIVLKQIQSLHTAPYELQVPDDLAKYRHPTLMITVSSNGAEK